jgi:hypothetical protein
LARFGAVDGPSRRDIVRRDSWKAVSFPAQLAFTLLYRPAHARPNRYA